MVFLATLWAAGLNLLLLLVALAWTPAFWSDPARWLGRLPWDNFGAELASLLSMQAVAAGAIWALWLCVSAVLSAGALVACALLKLRATPAAPTPPPPPPPDVSEMFGNLSSSLQGLQSFGDQGGAPPAPSVPASLPVPVLKVLAKVDPEASSSAIAASLQEIDPELGSTYASLLRELSTSNPNPRPKD
jgi:hypothetical protein